jgi:hypothetical protein
MRHARGDETLMKGGPDATPVELKGSSNGRYRLIFVGNDKPCDAVLDDFRHRGIALRQGAICAIRMAGHRPWRLA